jgi:hypothetical protein
MGHRLSEVQHALIGRVSVIFRVSRCIRQSVDDPPGRRKIRIPYPEIDEVHSLPP